LPVLVNGKQKITTNVHRKTENKNHGLIQKELPHYTISQLLFYYTNVFRQTKISSLSHWH